MTTTNTKPGAVAEAYIRTEIDLCATRNAHEWAQKGTEALADLRALIAERDTESELAHANRAEMLALRARCERLEAAAYRALGMIDAHFTSDVRAAVPDWYEVHKALCDATALAGEGTK